MIALFIDEMAFRNTCELAASRQKFAALSALCGRARDAIDNMLAITLRRAQRGLIRNAPLTSIRCRKTAKSYAATEQQFSNTTCQLSNVKQLISMV